jgi:anaerobic magnesium-protoporphyrin IX monomethyl ester cyclase
MDVLLMLVIGSRDSEYYRHMASMPPLGLLYLSSYLKQQTGVQIGLVDFQREKLTREAFQRQLATEKPQVVGVSVYTEARSNGLEVAAVVKSVLPSALVVFGGAYPTFVEPQEFRTLHDVDVLVRGEGEVTFTELVRHALGLPGAKPLREIPGITFKAGSDIVVNPPRALIPDLDALPFPDRSLVDKHFKKGEYEIPHTVSTSRGCPGNCVFCSSRAFWGNKVRFRSPQNVVDELMELVQKYHMRSFHILDDTFTARPRAVMEFCRLLQECKTNVFWSCESRADVATEELLQSLHDAGCRAIQFGIESGVQEVLDAIGKHVTVEQIEQAVARASKLFGMEVNGSFMVGHYCDTLETMFQTIRFVERLAQQYGLVPWMSVNTPFPGTPQFINRERLGLTIHTQELEDLVLAGVHASTSGFSTEDLRRIAVYGWDRLSKYMKRLSQTISRFDAETIMAEL